MVMSASGQGVPSRLKMSPSLPIQNMSMASAISCMRLRRVSGGLKKLDTLRSIGAQLQPLGLTTGYGEVLGNWCLKSIEEEQGAFLQGGIPRKQAFTLEFVGYGDDLQNR